MDNKNNNLVNFVTTVSFKEPVTVEGHIRAESLEDAKEKVLFTFSEVEDLEILSLEEISEEELMARVVEFEETPEPSKMH